MTHGTRASYVRGCHCAACRSANSVYQRGRTTAKPKRAKQLGVSDADYARLLDEQGGHCALCPATPKTRRLHADHDHATGAVRGLLCHRCNRNLPTWVTRAWLWNALLYLDDETISMTRL